MELLGKRWKYINEGNVHIVLQVLDTDYVLRFIKEDVKRVNLEHVRHCVDFVNVVMLPLLADDFNAKEETVQISEEASVELSAKLFDLRPECRRFKSLLCPCAIKVSNLATVSTKCKTNYCIEIKPKEGFMSKDLIQYSKCYYCLKQYLKLKSKEIEKPSKYCPLDLFSGEAHIMRMAVMNLVDNPQNNFKVFKDGSLVFSENSDRSTFDNFIKSLPYFKSTTMFLDFIVQVLLREDKDVNILLDGSEETIIVAEKYAQCRGKTSLKSNTFLYKLLQLQKLSENINIDLTNINEHTDYVGTILNKLNEANLNLSLPTDRQMFLDTADPIHLALISAVAKDCSIMISFSPDIDENFSYIQVKDCKLTYKVSITDLEPKSIRSLVKRKVTEMKMIQVYQHYKEHSTEDGQESNLTQKQEPNN